MKATMRVSDNTSNGANLRAGNRVGGRANDHAHRRACLCAYHCADPQAALKVRA
ncbi:hypothetical protein ACOTJG_26560 [Achromobacter xylosoxidans]|jgi:hypothetical protein|uniref:hypothetical protein n=1 Tax=Achromobacter TaxID=222 RepID=UPI0006C2C876|nr:hypothetical protein [Achromobacter xylosoxidans]MCH4596759.1 hypothetical protein [Achromobacter xylosoxidans]MCM2570222.1 hypothetical protein [Achromobacter xylosoxidans]MCZ8441499.1 hypothetical protein [Achromobacter xylosoxidans]MDC6165385.1 hypothetical protein [Achromobacter xylosoxidans]QQE55224.1 hypothetical protein I6H41_20060 [Achromobacter xylosoxidans]